MVYTLVAHLYAKEENVEKLKAKLKESSLVYSRDQETIDWFVMQDVKDPRKFTIVERYENEKSQKYHLDNPYWATFDPYVKPLLAKDIVLERNEELLPNDSGEKSRKHGEGVIPEDVKIDKDPELWAKVEKHQAHLYQQGNY